MTAWTALIAPAHQPAWPGPVREFRLLDRPATVPQPKIPDKSWERKKRQRARQQLASWIPWTLLTAANEAQMRAHRDHWPLRRVA